MTGGRNGPQRPGDPHRDGAAAAALQAALAHHRAGRLDEARRLYVAMLARQPDNADALNLLGVIELGAGHVDKALRLIGKATRLAPGHAGAHLNLGNTLLQAGRTQDAALSYQRALALDPGNPSAHSNLARAQTVLGDADAAIASCLAAIRIDPSFSAAFINLGAALVAAKRIAEAELAYVKAAALEPERAQTHRDLGGVQFELGKFAAARGSQERALALLPDHLPTLCAHGLACTHAGDAEAAEASFRRATEVDPKAADAWVGLGWSLRQLGRFAAADACFAQVRRLDPGNVEVYRPLASTGAPGQAADIEALARRLDDPATDRASRVVAGFALGRLLDNAGRTDEAFARYAAANADCRAEQAARGHCYDEPAFQRRLALLTRHYTGGYFASAEPGAADDMPVFVVGMPRSGTSLVEQIAASHSQVFGAGELQDIGLIADALAATAQREVAAHQADAGAAQALARAHRERLRSLGRGALQVIDKMPDNILHLGLIADLFPGARIVFCTRDARDIALSCFFQLFADRLQLFSYDLADCGRRTVAIERLASHWRRVLKVRMHEVNYETLVADLEGESRRLIAFLGLEWEPGCLDFHRTERAVVTNSHWQVRQPLYDRSVGRWRQYERHLGPLFEALA